MRVIFFCVSRRVKDRTTEREVGEVDFKLRGLVLFYLFYFFEIRISGFFCLFVFFFFYISRFVFLNMGLGSFCSCLRHT